MVDIFPPNFEQGFVGVLFFFLGQTRFKWTHLKKNHPFVILVDSRNLEMECFISLTFCFTLK